MAWLFSEESVITKKKRVSTPTACGVSAQKRTLSRTDSDKYCPWVVIVTSGRHRGAWTMIRVYDCSQTVTSA